MLTLYNLSQDGKKTPVTFTLLVNIVR